MNAYLTMLRRGWRNHLIDKGALRNRYFALRHGESEANCARKISCLPNFDSGLGHGLSSRGHDQARRVHLDFQALLQTTVDPMRTKIFASDFRRTVETAEHLREALELPPTTLLLSAALRERDFGPLNNESDELYSRVWADDLESEFGMRCVEPAAAVQSRASSFVDTLESIYESHVIVLVGHGDLLQIMQTAFEGMNARDHRSIPHLAQCEMRELTLRNRATAT